MIDVNALKIVSAISQKQLIQDVLTENEYRIYLNTFVYPIGAIPTYSFGSTISNLFPTITERLQYFGQLISFVLPEYYSQEELEIVKYYFLMWCGDISSNLNNLVETIETVISIETEKLDIQYCINELKYALALFYAQNQRQYGEKLQHLIPELEAIYEQHNHILLSEKKNV